MMDPPDPGHVSGHASQPSETVRVDSALPKNGRTFRARGVPLEWDANRLESFLADHEGSVGPVVRSLATETHGRSQSATVSFQNLSHHLQAVHTGQTRSVLLPKSSGGQPARPQYLVLDHDFFGITTLFIPPLDDHKVDVIAISGLGGHAFGSFKKRGGDYMWLRDSLPYDVVDSDTGDPIARVMIYGYESSVANSNSFQNIEDLATSFHSSLRVLADSPTTRPVILVAHSLGGLIVKQTLISLSKSKHEDDARLSRAVYGIMFFGVPHDGMDISSLIPMVGDRPNRFLIESISHVNSQILIMQQRAFHTALGEEGDSEIVCFYETEKSPTARKDENGDWSMLGPKTCLVTKSSATHCRSWEDGPEHICAIARTHSAMVKFEPYDHEYDIVCTRLKGLARRALTARRRVQSSDARFLVPYVQNHNFVGRLEILESLKLQLGYGLRQKPVKQRSRVSLFGLGGVGKTQIALAYVYWLRQKCPDISVFWVHASNRERFRQSYASIAEECDIPGQDDPQVDVLVLVKDWLEKRFKSRWLMVIDNADDTQLFSHPQNIRDSIKASVRATGADGGLGRYVPECAHGSVLTTSRDKQTALRLSQSKRPIEINRMTDGEADLLMRTILEDDGISTQQTSLLTTRLEHLPLALAQAAAFIQENTISVSRYIQLLDESDVALFDRLSEPFETVGRDSETPHAVTATWMLSFEQIEKQDRFTGEVLFLISLFDRQAIPREFITHYWQKEGVPEADQSSQEVMITKALGTLKAFCFVSEAKDESLDMHRLVQLVARKWLVMKGKMAEFAQHALEAVSGTFPYGEFETQEVCLRYLPHAYTVLENESIGLKEGKLSRARLLHNVTGYFFYKGCWKEAEQYQAAAVELRKKVLGEEHPDTLTSMGNLTSIYSNQGRWKEAEELELEVLETSKRTLGEEHPHTLTSMANLASSYSDRGQWKEAEQLELEVLEIRKRVIGEEHPDTLISMANLAMAYCAQGQWIEAEELGVDVIEIKKKVLGEEHPDTLISMGNLASTYSGQGRQKEAEELELEVLEVRKRVLGEQHPNTLMSMGNLASTYSNQGRWEEAEELELEVLEIRKRVLGEEHPDTLVSMGNLASIYSDRGRWKEAEELELEVLEIRKRLLGEEHPDTLLSMGNLASRYSDQGRWKEAEELELEVLEIRKRVLGEEHPDTLVIMANLALTYSDQGRWKDAEELELEVLEIRKRVLGEEHPDTLVSMGNLASIYSDRGRWKDAEELELEVLEIRKRVLGEENPDTLTSIANLAWLYRDQGKFNAALALMQECVFLRRRVLGTDNPDTLFSETTLARWQE